MLLSQSFFVLCSLFLGALAAAPPPTLYRGDSRSPADIKKIGGFHTYAATNGVEPREDLILHCQGGHDDNDAFISTSKSNEVASKFGKKKSGWVYTIDSSKNPSQYIDVAAWCKEHQEKNPHPKEQEFASKGAIPWSNIISWEKVEKGSKVAGSSETRAEFDAGKTSSRPSSSHSSKGGKSHKRFAA